MGLAGESLVQARQLRPLVDAVEQLKNEQTQLWDRLQALEHDLSGLTPTEAEQPRERLVAAKHQVDSLFGVIGRSRWSG